MDLRERFFALWSRLEAFGDPGKAFDLLVNHYSEPHRAYHTLEHITFCLEELEDLGEIADDKDAVEWAIWFHDVIYQIPGIDNEQKSADLSSEIGVGSRLRSTFLTKVARLILVTKTHVPSDKAGSYDEKIVSDIDLSILGQEPEVFDEYERQIFAEYTGVYTPTDFRRGMARLLEEFLKRERIYFTPRFAKRFESRARENLNRSIVRLKTTP